MWPILIRRTTSGLDIDRGYCSTNSGWKQSRKPLSMGTAGRPAPLADAGCWMKLVDSGWLPAPRSTSGWWTWVLCLWLTGTSCFRIGGSLWSQTVATTPSETTICKHKRVNNNHNSFCNINIDKYIIISNSINYNIGTGVEHKKYSSQLAGH